MTEGINSDLQRQIEEAAAAEAEKYQPAAPRAAADLDSDFIEQCLENNERGDGLLFAELHRGRFIFDATSGRWMSWRGHYWETDITGKALAAVEDAAAVYVREMAGINRQLSAAQDEALAKALYTKQKKLKRRVERLRSTRGRKNTLEFAASLGDGSLVVTGDKFDNQPWLLACQNGVVDLKSAEQRPGRPEDLITKAATAEWRGLDEPAPTWEKFILDIMDGDQSKADFLRRVYGYGITGLTREHVFLLLFGGGRNGKGTLTETLMKILGPLAGPIQSDMLLDQGRVRNSAGPSPDIMTLRGLRLAIASETEQNRRVSAARVKWMSGGDTLTGRNPHDRDTISFSPTHLLVLGTNFKPRADSDDPAFWARMLLVDFPLAFVDRPVAKNERPIDRTLESKLMEEAPGILAWLVRGCLEWQRDGLAPPPAILAATAAYRRKEDDFADFLEDRCVVGEGKTVSAKELYSSFKNWYTTNISDKPLSQKRFGEGMSRRFEKDDKGPGKTIRYLGVGLLGGFEDE